MDGLTFASNLAGRTSTTRENCEFGKLLVSLSGA